MQRRCAATVRQSSVQPWRWTLLHATLALVVAWRQPTVARMLDVGAEQLFKVPSAAASVAQDGDTVSIAPGLYYDCAFWRANRLTIAGTGPDVVITDVACAGKAAFVISGNDVVVRNLEFTRIRVPDGNGAGIRAEGINLTVENSRFVNNQWGILASGQHGSLRIVNCMFSANGISLDGQPTHAVLAGGLDLLRIERSSFESARGGDHIASSALKTELVDNRLSDEGAVMSEPLVTVSDGQLTLDGNTVELGADASARPGAILVTGNTSLIVVRNNALIEPHGSVPLLRNWTAVTASETANRVPAHAVTVSHEGATYHRLRARMARLRDQAHAMVAAARHKLAVLARRLHLIR